MLPMLSTGATYSLVVIAPRCLAKKLYELCPYRSCGAFGPAYDTPIRTTRYQPINQPIRDFFEMAQVIRTTARSSRERL